MEPLEPKNTGKTATWFFAFRTRAQQDDEIVPNEVFDLHLKLDE